MSAPAVEVRREPRTLLEQLVREREQTYAEQVQAFGRLAGELGEPATLTVRHLQRLAAGQRSAVRANPTTRRVMRQMYGHSLDELLAPPSDRIPEAAQASVAGCPRCSTTPAEPVVDVWTGRHTRAIQRALRMTNQSFAERLGVAARTVAKWHAHPHMEPSPELQEALDTLLSTAPDAAQARFVLLVGTELAGEVR